MLTLGIDHGSEFRQRQLSLGSDLLERLRKCILEWPSRTSAARFSANRFSGFASRGGHTCVPALWSGATGSAQTIRCASLRWFWSVTEIVPAVPNVTNGYARDARRSEGKISGRLGEGQGGRLIVGVREDDARGRDGGVRQELAAGSVGVPSATPGGYYFFGLRLLPHFV
jgi:hypothetical protein